MADIPKHMTVYIVVPEAPCDGEEIRVCTSFAMSLGYAQGAESRLGKKVRVFEAVVTGALSDLTKPLVNVTNKPLY